jgi:hypothetical protein
LVSNEPLSQFGSNVRLDLGGIQVSLGGERWFIRFMGKPFDLAIKDRNQMRFVIEILIKTSAWWLLYEETGLFRKGIPFK